MPPSPGFTRPGDWDSYPAGAIIQCPGYNNARKRACGTGMGQVAPGRRAFVRVKAAQIDSRTAVVRHCRRCQQLIELRIDTAAPTSA